MSPWTRFTFFLANITEIFFVFCLKIHNFPGYKGISTHKFMFCLFYILSQYDKYNIYFHSAVSFQFLIIKLLQFYGKLLKLVSKRLLIKTILIIWLNLVPIQQGVPKKMPACVTHSTVP